MRRSIFLGDANVLSLSSDCLLSVFEEIQKGFPESEVGPSWRETYACDLFFRIGLINASSLCTGYVVYWQLFIGKG